MERPNQAGHSLRLFVRPSLPSVTTAAAERRTQADLSLRPSLPLPAEAVAERHHHYPQVVGAVGAVAEASPYGCRYVGRCCATFAFSRAQGTRGIRGSRIGV